MLQAQSPQPDAPVAVKPASVKEVALDIVVRDDKGKPLPEIKPTDIGILDAGKRVSISGIHLVNGDAERVVALVFDHMDQLAARVARNVADDAIKTAGKDKVSFAVLKIDARLRLVQGFTSDREAVRQAVLAVTGGIKEGYGPRSQAAEKALVSADQTGEAGGQKVSAEERASAHSMLTMLKESQAIVQYQHVKDQLAAILALARFSGGLPGRKAAIVFSRGLSSTARDRMTLISIVATANRSGLSIYGVDVNPLTHLASSNMMNSFGISNGMSMSNGMSNMGMSNNGMSNNSMSNNGVNSSVGTGVQPPRLDPTQPGGPLTPQQQLQQQQQQQQMGRLEFDGSMSGAGALADLSLGTGGVYIPASGDPRKPLRRMMEDLTTYYRASFIPASDPADGTYHQVRVQPLRKRIRIQAPSGYSLAVAGKGLAVSPFEVPLLKTLDTIQDGAQLPSEVQFRAAVVRMGKTPSGNVSSVVVETPLRGIDMQEDANTRLFSARLSVLARITNRAGVVIEKFSEDIPRQGALEAEQKERAGFVTFQRHFAAPPGKYILETAVMDRHTEKIGAQRTTFDIDPVPDGPALSDIAMVLRTDPLAEGSDPDEPLLYGKARVVPDLRYEFSRNEKEISLYFVLHPDARSTEKPKLELEVIRGGQSLRRIPLEMQLNAGASAIPYMTSLQGGSLEPGNYETKAILTQGAKKAESTVLFTVNEVQEAIRTPLPAAPNSEQPATLEKGASERSLFVFTSPATALAPPPAEEMHALVESARERATEYTYSLPNFMCIEVTHRSIDPSGLGSWRQRDTIAELLRYHDETEQRVTLQVNGSRSDMKRSDFQGTLTLGEFGGLLNAVFNAASKADFQWKETASLGSGNVQVFSYRVTRDKSQFAITGSTNNAQIKVAYHGLVMIDSQTYGVRRLTLEADDIPTGFPTRSALMTVDYDYVAIGRHDYLMPIAGTVQVGRGKRSIEANEIEFRDYKHYGADSYIKFDELK
jgi:VWFA-related protein